MGYKSDREYMPVGLDTNKHQISRLSGWGIGIEDQWGDFGMTDGPFVSEQAALNVIGQRGSRIIHFRTDGGDEITWYWRGDRWYKRWKAISPNITKEEIEDDLPF